MGIEMFGILVVMGVAMYFLMIRPAKKQQQKQQEMMNSLEVGVRVMLGSGIYGTIRHLGEKQAVIEISPGVDLTVLRAAIRSVVSADEDEFEYSEEPDEVPADSSEPIYDPMQAFEADVASSPFAPEAPADETADSESEGAENDDEKK